MIGQYCVSTHGLGDVEPTKQYVPEGHTVIALAVSQKLPAGHTTHPCPAKEYVPGTHCKHPVRAGFSAIPYAPAGNDEAAPITVTKPVDISNLLMPVKPIGDA